MSIEFTLEVRPYGSAEPYTDITNLLKEQGFKWSRNDIDAANSGRDTQDGKMHRRRVASPKRYDIACKPLTQAELSQLLTLIDYEWLDARAYDPKTMTKVVKKMYVSTVPATFLFDDHINQYWTGVAFNMIEE